MVFFLLKSGTKKSLKTKRKQNMKWQNPKRIRYKSSFSKDFAASYKCPCEFLLSFYSKTACVSGLGSFINYVEEGVNSFSKLIGVIVVTTSIP